MLAPALHSFQIVIRSCRVLPNKRRRDLISNLSCIMLNNATSYARVGNISLLYTGLTHSLYNQTLFSFDHFHSVIVTGTFSRYWINWVTNYHLFFKHDVRDLLIDLCLKSVKRKSLKGTMFEWRRCCCIPSYVIFKGR